MTHEKVDYSMGCMHSCKHGAILCPAMGQALGDSQGVDKHWEIPKHYMSHVAAASALHGPEAQNFLARIKCHSWNEQLPFPSLSAWSSDYVKASLSLEIVKCLLLLLL